MASSDRASTPGGELVEEETIGSFILHPNDANPTTLQQLAEANEENPVLHLALTTLAACALRAGVEDVQAALHTFLDMESIEREQFTTITDSIAIVGSVTEFNVVQAAAAVSAFTQPSPSHHQPVGDGDSVQGGGSLPAPLLGTATSPQALGGSLQLWQAGTPSPAQALPAVSSEGGSRTATPPSSQGTGSVGGLPGASASGAVRVRRSPAGRGRGAKPRSSRGRRRGGGGGSATADLVTRAAWMTQ